MNPAALLGRLKLPSLPRLKRRGSAAGEGEDHPKHGLRALGRPAWLRMPFRAGMPPKSLIAATAGVVAALAGLAGWLSVAGEESALSWLSSIPHVTVAIQGAAPPPAPADKAHGDEHGAADKGHAKAPEHAGEPAKPPPKSTEAPAIVLPPPDVNVTMAPAPAPGLVEETKVGPLPRIAEDGRRPWQIYARPFPATDKRPRVAIVLTDMGLSGVTTGQALDKLPPAITLAFVPYGERLDSWVERARGQGHEVMMSVGMEPIFYPRDDPGPNALFISAPADRISERLTWALSRVVGYTGITTTTGSKFTGSPDAMKPVLEVLKQRGLLYLDPRLAAKPAGLTLAGQMGVPRAVVDRVIDRELTRGSIDDQLRELETIAKSQGAAVGLGFSYPITVERIGLWAPTVGDRGVVLAPLSAVVNMQKGLGG